MILTTLSLNIVLLLHYVECIYAFYRGYWIFPLICALLSLAANFAQVAAICKRHTTTLGLISLRRLAPVVQQGWVRALPSYKLVPGDVIVVQIGKATCNVVMLRGSCLVEKSMLSGEVTALLSSCVLRNEARALFANIPMACLVQLCMSIMPVLCSLTWLSFCTGQTCHI